MFLGINWSTAQIEFNYQEISEKIYIEYELSFLVEDVSKMMFVLNLSENKCMTFMFLSHIPWVFQNFDIVFIYENIFVNYDVLREMFTYDFFFFLLTTYKLYNSCNMVLWKHYYHHSYKNNKKRYLSTKHILFL